MLENAAYVILGQDTTLIFVDEEYEDSRGDQGIDPDRLRYKISEAGAFIAQSAHPQKAINPIHRPKPRQTEPDSNDVQKIIEYPEEPGIRFPPKKQPNGYIPLGN
jgi:hypothetical protein